MATLALHRLKAGFGTASARSDESLRRVAIRLAAQTVGLLLVMLLVLELVVYLTTQRLLLGSLEDTLKQRASLQDYQVCAALNLGCGEPNRGAHGLGGPSHGRFWPDPFPPPGPGDPQSGLSNRNPAEVSVVFLDTLGQRIRGDGPRSSITLDPSTVRLVLARGGDQCCTTRPYLGQNYLVYTKALRRHNRAVGAVQASISKFQYEGTMRTLRTELLEVALLGLLISSGISVVLVRRALDPIRAAMQRQRDFVADAAHELRTPLAIQRTVAEVGLTEDRFEDREATIEQMLVENRHLTRLVDDLSLLARADSNAVAINHDRMDLSELVAGTASELVPLAEEQGVRLTSEVSSGIWVLGDAMRLRQLLLVLLDNALKHTPSGGEVIVRLGARSGRAQLSVLDTGPGIDPAHLPRIFDRFYRVDKARSGEGSGLGLAIARWIVQAHSGHIQAENRAPHGAIFTATLPVLRADSIT